MIDWNDPADWTHLVATRGGASTQDVTLESLLALRREIEAAPRPDFDAIVCLPVAYRRLREEFPSAAMMFDRIYGVPVYFAATAFEAACIVRDLTGEGRKVMLMAGPGDPQSIPKLPPRLRMDQPLSLSCVPPTSPSPGTGSGRPDESSSNSSKSRRDRSWGSGAKG